MLSDFEFMLCTFGLLGRDTGNVRKATNRMLSCISVDAKV